MLDKIHRHTCLTNLGLADGERPTSLNGKEDEAQGDVKDLFSSGVDLTDKVKIADSIRYSKKIKCSNIFAQHG